MVILQADKRLSGTLSGEKNEILFSQFGINYNNEPEMYRKGSVLVKKPRPPRMPRKVYMKSKESQAAVQDNAGEDSSSIIELYCDIIQDKFWDEYPHLLGNFTKVEVDDTHSKNKLSSKGEFISESPN